MPVLPGVLVLRLAPIGPETRAELQQQLGPIRFTSRGAEFDLTATTPEEVLSACAALGIRVDGSRDRWC